MKTYRNSTLLFILAFLLISPFSYSQYIYRSGTEWDIKSNVTMKADTDLMIKQKMIYNYTGLCSSGLSGNSSANTTGNLFQKFDSLPPYNSSDYISDTLFLQYDSSTSVSSIKDVSIHKGNWYKIYLISNPVKLVHLRFDTITNKLVLLGKNKLINTEHYKFEIDSINTLTYKVLLSWNSISLTSSTPPILATLFPIVPISGTTTNSGAAPTNNNAPLSTERLQEIKTYNPGLGNITKIDTAFQHKEALLDYRLLILVDSDYSLLNLYKSRDSSIDYLCNIAEDSLYSLQQKFNQVSEDFILNDIRDKKSDFTKNMAFLLKEKFKDSVASGFIKLKDYYKKNIDYNTELSLIYSFGDKTFQDAEIALSDYQRMIDIGRESTFLVNYIFLNKNKNVACKKEASIVKQEMEKTLALPSNVHNKDSAIAHSTYYVRDFFARYSTFLIWMKALKPLGSDNELETYLMKLEFCNQFVEKNIDTLSKVISFVYSVDKTDVKIQSPTFINLTDVTELYVNIVDQIGKDTLKFKTPFYNCEGPKCKSIKFDFTTGFFWNSLYSKTYYLIPAPTPIANTVTNTNTITNTITNTTTTTNTVTTTSTNTVTTTSNTNTTTTTGTTTTTTPGSIGVNHVIPCNLAIGALMNITSRINPGLKVGVSLGVSLSFLDATTQYMAGGCLIAGKLKQFCFSIGTCFGNQTLLSSDVSSNGRTPNSIIPAGLTAVPTYTKFSFGVYAGVTYTIYTIP